MKKQRPLTHTPAPHAERTRHSSDGACAGAGAGATALTKRLGQIGDKDVLEEKEEEEKEVEEKEEEEEKEVEAEEDKADLLALIDDYGALEEQQEESERLVRVAGQRLVELLPVIGIGQQWLLGRTERVAAGGPLGSYSPGYIDGAPEWHWLEPMIRRLKNKEEKAITELVAAQDKAKRQRLALAELSRMIDDLNMDVKEREDQARGFAEHCAQEQEYALTR